MAKRNYRHIHTSVTAQTLWHLERLQRQCGYSSIGHVIDKLVREKQMQLKEGDYYGCNDRPPRR